MNRSTAAALGIFCVVAGLAGITVAIFLGIDLWNNPDPAFSRSQLLRCNSYLDAICLAFTGFAQDHEGKFPFNVSTNFGGALELCARGSGEVDRNAEIHFQVLANQISDPAFLVCPNDARTKAAADFPHLQASNITYLLRSGTNLNRGSTEILLMCPVDGNLACANGTLKFAAEVTNLPADLQPYLRRNRGTFRRAMAQVVASSTAALLLLALGMWLRRRSGE